MLVKEAERVFGSGQVDVHLHGLSHANHHFSQHDEHEHDQTANIYGLQFQIDHAEAFVRSSLGLSDSAFDAAAGCPPLPMLSFIGHSIGAYIVLDMLDRYALLARACTSCTLLMPFM